MVFVLFCEVFLYFKSLDICKTNVDNDQPGWNDYVSNMTNMDLYYKKCANSNFKYALGFVKRDDNTVRSSSIMRKSK